MGYKRDLELVLPKNWKLVKRSTDACLCKSELTGEYVAWSISPEGRGVCHGWYGTEEYAALCFKAKRLGHYPAHYIDELEA